MPFGSRHCPCLDVDMSEQATGEVLMRRWFDEVWNQGRLETIDELLAADCVANGITDAADRPVRGPGVFRAFVEQYRQAFPDIHMSLEQVISEGDWVAVRCRVRGTHTEDGFAGPATGNAVDFTGMSMGRVRDGKFVEAWDNFDSMRMFQHIRLIISPSKVLRTFQL